MFNVAILKLKDILKYFIGIILILLIIIFVSKSLKENNIIEKLGKEITLISKNNMLFALDKTIPVISNVNKEYKNNITENQNINYYNSNLTTIKYFDLKKYVKNITRNNFIDKYKDEYFKDTSIDPNASNLINKINKRIEEIEKQEFLDNKNNIG